jgi:hypothetical protein
MGGDRAVLSKVGVKLDLGFFSIDTEWASDPRQRQAAWELYVELATRIATQPLDPSTGIAREALTSLHSIFASTRQILRAAGPDIGADTGSVGYIALSVLNHGLRPFLSRWHPALLAWEAQRPASVSEVEHERRWQHDTDLRGQLEVMRAKMWLYGGALGQIAGISKKR